MTNSIPNDINKIVPIVFLLESSKREKYIRAITINKLCTGYILYFLRYTESSFLWIAKLTYVSGCRCCSSSINKQLLLLDVLA